MKDIKRLERRFNERVCVKDYGKSEKGRNLPLIIVGSTEKACLAVGGIHGREAVTSLFLMRCLEEFLSCGCDKSADISLWLCPMANPDGVEIFWGREKPLVSIWDFDHRLFKNNANNVNLNANFPFEFSQVPQNRQGGIFAASEKESRSLIKLCEDKAFESAVSIHARGNCIFWRDNGNGRVEGDFSLAKSLEKHCGFELIKPTEKAEDYSGGFENWFRHRFRRPGLCVELVKDEAISFEGMCGCFEQAVEWKSTKKLLRLMTNTENLLSNQKPVTMG